MWATHLVRDFDEEAEAFGGLQEQPVGDVLAEILGFCAGLHLKCLQRRITGHIEKIFRVIRSPRRSVKPRYRKTWAHTQLLEKNTLFPSWVCTAFHINSLGNTRI